MAKKTDLPNERRALPDGRTKIQLTTDERAAARSNLQVEEAIIMFLDIEQSHTYNEIAETLGISVAALKRLTATDIFQNMYTEQLAVVGHDPRLQAATANMLDLVSPAMRKLRGILTSVSTSDTVALKAIQMVLDAAGVGASTSVDDPRALQDFLRNNGATIQGDVNVLQIVTPDSYLEAMNKYFVTPGDNDIVEGEVSTLDSETPDSPETEPTVIAAE